MLGGSVFSSRLGDVRPAPYGWGGKGFSIHDRDGTAKRLMRFLREMQLFPVGIVLAIRSLFMGNAERISRIDVAVKCLVAYLIWLAVYFAIAVIFVLPETSQARVLYKISVENSSAIGKNDYKSFDFIHDLVLKNGSFTDECKNPVVPRTAPVNLGPGLKNATVVFVIDYVCYGAASAHITIIKDRNDIIWSGYGEYINVLSTTHHDVHDISEQMRGISSRCGYGII